MIKLSIELDVNEWFTIHAMLVVMQEDLAKRIGHNPLAYSRTARATNNFAEAFLKNITNDQLDEYLAWRQSEKDDVS